MNWLRIKLFWYSDIISADLGIGVSFAGPLLRPWNPFGSNRRTAEINRPKSSSDLWITTFGSVRTSGAHCRAEEYFTGPKQPPRKTRWFPREAGQRMSPSWSQLLKLGTPDQHRRFPTFWRPKPGCSKSSLSTKRETQTRWKRWERKTPALGRR